MILGGVSLTLSDLVSAFTALANDGRSQRLRLRDDDAISERYLLSPASAFIVRRILQDAPRPTEFGLHHPLLQRQRAPLAFKTGTSYGFRDAWAIGVAERYVIGVWVGRADGTPLPGEFGLHTAAPLLFAVHQQLDEPLPTELPLPADVSEVVICWPLGRAKQQTDMEHCHREKKALTISGVTPPTLPAIPHDNISNPVSVQIDRHSGRLVDADCNGVTAINKTIALWPKAVEPFLPTHLRRQTLLPRRDQRCHNAIAVAAGQLDIIGLRDGMRLRTPSGQRQLPRISLHAIGGQGTQQWFVNGRYVATTVVAGSALYQFEHVGEHQLVVVDEGGNSARVTVFIETE
jgi:penicillin-binding protein 1C